MMKIHLLICIVVFPAYCKALGILKRPAKLLKKLLPLNWSTVVNIWRCSSSWAASSSMISPKGCWWWFLYGDFLKSGELPLAWLINVFLSLREMEYCFRADSWLFCSMPWQFVCHIRLWVSSIYPFLSWCCCTCHRRVANSPKLISLI